MNFKFNLISAAVTLVALSLSQASLAAPGDDGHGGGGIKRNGEYLTFASAKLHLTMAEIDEIEGLDLLEKSIVKMDVGSVIKERLFHAVAPGSPTEKRHYYFVDQISPVENARLLAIYRSTMQVTPKDVMVLYAVTDPESKETYLLPNFKKLKTDAEKAQVLFHESAWVLNEVGYLPTYTQVLKAELAFAAYLDGFIAGVDTFQLKLYEDIAAILGDSGIPLVAALNYDFRKKNFKITSYGSSLKILLLDKQLLTSNTLQILATARAQQNPEVALYKVLARSPNLHVLWQYGVPSDDAYIGFNSSTGDCERYTNAEYADGYALGKAE